MNHGYDRETIALGVDNLRRCTIDELARDCYVPASYMRALIIERGDDFGDAFVDVIASALGVSVDEIVAAA